MAAFGDEQTEDGLWSLLVISLSANAVNGPAVRKIFDGLVRLKMSSGRPEDTVTCVRSILSRIEDDMGPASVSAVLRQYIDDGPFGRNGLESFLGMSVYDTILTCLTYGKGGQHVEWAVQRIPRLEHNLRTALANEILTKEINITPAAVSWLVSRVPCKRRRVDVHVD